MSHASRFPWSPCSISSGIPAAEFSDLTSFFLIRFILACRSTSSSSSQSSADSKNDNAAQEVTSAAPPLAATSEEEPAEAEAPTGKEESTNSSPLHSAVPPAASTPVERRSESPTPAEMTIPEENESTGKKPPIRVCQHVDACFCRRFQTMAKHDSAALAATHIRLPCPSLLQQAPSR